MERAWNPSILEPPLSLNFGEKHNLVPCLDHWHLGFYSGRGVDIPIQKFCEVCRKI